MRLIELIFIFWQLIMIIIITITTELSLPFFRTLPLHAESYTAVTGSPLPPVLNPNGRPLQQIES